MSDGEEVQRRHLGIPGDTKRGCCSRRVGYSPDIADVVHAEAFDMVVTVDAVLIHLGCDAQYVGLDAVCPGQTLMCIIIEASL